MVGSAAGFTLVEIVVVMAFVLIGLLAAVGSMDRVQTSVTSSELREQAVRVGQREIERLRTYAYADLKLSTLPTPGADGVPAGDPMPGYPRNPHFYVKAPGYPAYEIKTDYGDKFSGAPAGVSPSGERLVEAGGTIVSGPQTYTVASTRVSVYRYLTYRNDNRCPNALCPGDNDSKRVTVAVVAGSGPDAIRPIYFSTVVVPPY